jgi:stage V sporulation protein G
VEITEVRIKLMDDPDDRLQAFCSITFDNCFVVRDLKIIEGASGPFVAMPSRKLTAHCPQCGCKNHLRSAYCNQCGQRLKDDLAVKDAEGRAKLYADIAHPINSSCREMIQNRVISEYRAELDRSQQPDYVSRYDDYYGDAGEPDVSPAAHEAAASRPVPSPPSAPPSRPPAERPEQAVPERTQHVQPAEPQPRPPHKTPSTQPGGKRQGKQGGEEFGAGIF